MYKLQDVQIWADGKKALPSDVFHDDADLDGQLLKNIGPEDGFAVWLDDEKVIVGLDFLSDPWAGVRIGVDLLEAVELGLYHITKDDDLFPWDNLQVELYTIDRIIDVLSARRELLKAQS